MPDPVAPFEILGQGAIALHKFYADVFSPIPHGFISPF
jgi:hypothetical protein